MFDAGFVLYGTYISTPWAGDLATFSCVQRCPAGLYPFLTFDPTMVSAESLTLDQLQTQICMPCDPTCYTCQLGDPYSCTSCSLGEFLVIADPITKTGSCQSKVRTYSTINLTVTGDRTAVSSDPYYVDLLGAIYAAYE